ncbi:MAG: glycosyltransferase family 2 protein [Bacteroidetes bacterium]|nr:glycosyltransferase family 2 protein [Bacteroidota bacterium]
MYSQPLVSVCVPVYNTEKYIAETILCVLNQSYQNIELIISDNASTDKTVEIINSFNDTRIKLFKNSENIGLVANFSKAFSYANGKYMMFLGADDGMELNTVEKCINIFSLSEEKNIVIVNTYINIINDESQSVFKKKYLFGGGFISKYWGIRSNFLYGSNTIGEPNGSMFLKEAYDKIPKPLFVNSNMWTIDIDLKNELFLIGNGYMISEALGKFRLSAQSTSKKSLKFQQAKLFRKYAWTIYKDKRYKLSFFWVITATINSILLEVARNVFYALFIRNKAER